MMFGKTRGGGCKRANCNCFFTKWFFMSQTILNKLQKWEKYWINSDIDRQIRTRITLKMLPPFGPNSLSNSKFRFPLSKHCQFIRNTMKTTNITQEEKIQDISEK
jgi:hypothetical protein